MSDFSEMTGAAVVAGGSGGLGAEICALLAARGSDVALSFNNNEARAAAVVKRVTASERRARAWQVALDDEAAASDFIKEAASVFGGIHTLIYASGPHVPMKHLSGVSPTEFRRQIETDAVAFFNLAHAALPYLRESKGSIVAVTTVANRRFPMRDGLSAAPKGAVEGTMRALAAEEGKYGVRANCVGPGIIGDGMTARLVETGEIDTPIMEATKAMIPMRRLGSAADIARAVCFLASSDAGYITGQRLDVDGGFSI